jgi:hypothetical protein
MAHDRGRRKDRASRFCAGGSGVRRTRWRIRRREDRTGSGCVGAEKPAGGWPGGCPGHGGRGRQHGAGAHPHRGEAPAVQSRHGGHPARPAGRFPRRLGLAAGARFGRRVLLAGFLGPTARTVAACLAGLLVTPPRGVPPAAGRLFGVSWRSDVVSLGPGELLFGREAAAVPPALFCGAAAAGVVLARERLALFLAWDRGEREADGGGEVCGQGEAGCEPAQQRSPAAVPSGRTHGVTASLPNLRPSARNYTSGRCEVERQGVRGTSR